MIDGETQFFQQMLGGGQAAYIGESLFQIDNHVGAEMHYYETADAFSFSGVSKSTT
uniref:Uncharacterized protein n=1 Tax=Candidatus Kentrum sp. MB TaxID=2138164 RepID=A0A450X1V3_9GAMM|nr:MAG: hypothetical protein BECKMB1821G_GA0114241_100445 [Candidatus Kentron sp. MB]VFK28404.1 MAG: hypothetical protein BECKMB1821I_GA0114274_100643 [Candidatus Kentron sp. MB]VFK74240.1 MAG: hypothetical protein BECKMB1821H_GA0114242_100261 [Candidatus Kentron sp. MB]